MNHRKHLLFFIFVATSLTVFTQDSLGWERDDTVKVNLYDGYIVGKYLPFDVPFYMVGNNKNIDKVELTIIAADRQACCNRQSLIRLEIQNKSKGSYTDCESCYSVHEQRLEFFSIVDSLNSDTFLDWMNQRIQFLRDVVKDNKKFTELQSNYTTWTLDEIYDGQLKYTIAQDSLQTLTNDSSFYYQFGKKYGWNELGNHSDNWDELSKFSKDRSKLLDRDKYRVCPNCEFDNRKCNIIKPWVRSSTLQNDSNFFLSIPPLDPNKNYVFFFDVTRNINTEESKALRAQIARDVQLQADSMIAVYIDFMKSNNYNVDKIRDLLLVREAHLELKTLVKELIVKELHKRLRDAVRIDAKEPEIDEKKVDRFVDHLIQHRLYSDFVMTNYSIVDDAMVYSSLNHRSGLNGILTTIESKRTNFLRLGLEDKYALFNRLIVANNDVNCIYLGAQDRTIPTGLVPLDNLQTIPLRDLNLVNDFNPDSVAIYLENVDNYLAFLEKLNRYILQDLMLKNENNIRLKLFESTEFLNSKEKTAYQKQVRDKEILRDLERLSSALESHYLRVKGTRNYYQNYQDNLSVLYTASKIMIDDFISDNQDIQIQVNRTTGGATSADFKTRTDWFVTADIGLAYIPFGDDFNSSVVPYFGANFNLRPINRQAHYGLFASGSQKRKLRYLGAAYDNKWRTEPFFKKLYKASSIVIGFTTTDINGDENERSDLISIANQNLNLLTGWGIRLTDAARFSTGAIWTNKITTTPATPTTAETSETDLKRYFYFSLSFDVDVAAALGKFGELLKGG